MQNETFVERLWKKMPRSSLMGQFVRYLVTGGFAFVVDFLLYAFCLYELNWLYLVANLVGLMAGLVINYVMSVAWVFSECRRVLENRKTVEFSVFAIVGIIGVGINELLMLFMVGMLDANEMKSKIAAAILVLMWNFGARKMVLFRERKVV